ncbi:MAG TPA: hypothetical protein VMD91_06175 [Candidatus Sulfotelmatobacter sp.]|nr:hypothetical protein [Candidatus Sulfotelmatobacter sp.]
MRRLLVVLLAASFGLPLLAAGPSSILTNKPVVMVFPFTPNGSSIDREAVASLAVLLAQQMANTGKVSVVPAPPGTDRPAYLEAARKGAADYYVAGFISPLGNGASLVEQVVSTSTGIVVFSHSAQINTVADAASEGVDLADWLGIYSNRAFADVGTPPPAPTAAPTAGNEANLSGLTKLFHKRSGGAAPAASAAPASAARGTAVAAAPNPAEYTVLPVGGSADASLRTAAAQVLAERAHGLRAESGAAACSAHPDTKLVTGTLATKAAGFGTTRATFALKVSVCGGVTLWSQSTSERGKPTQATEKAVSDALAGYFTAAKRPS